LFAINLYRDQNDGSFDELDVQRLLGLAPILKRAHRNALCVHLASPDLQLRAPEIERALQRTAPLLSARERSVCALIACGVGADGIAAELGIAPSTVATLAQAGGANDFVARLIGQHLAKSLGQAVIVANKAGANGAVGLGELARACTTVLGAPSSLPSDMISPAVQSANHHRPLCHRGDSTRPRSPAR
jgi:hypothetical protein